MYIPIDVLEKLKSRLHIVNSESDRNLEEMIEESIVRVRYAYNDVLEHFEKNFSREITDLQMQLFFERSEQDEKNESNVQ